MKSYKAYSDSSYLKKEDFPKPEVLTIQEVREERVTAPGKKKSKVVIYFEGFDKGLVLNLANGDALFDMTGTDDPEKWIGQCVEAFNDPSVAYAGKRVGGIRLRKPAQATNERSSADIDSLNAELSAVNDGEEPW